YHKAVGEIRANEAIRKQDIGEARAAYSELSLRSAAGARIESDEVEQVAGAFRAAGDPGGAARVYSAFIRKPLNDDFGRQPLSAQTQQLTALQGANAAAAAHPFFIPTGDTPENPAGGLGYQSRLAMARAVFNGKPADASMGPAGSAWLAANRRSQVDDTAAAQWKTVMSDYTKEQTRPSLQQVNDIVQ